MAAVADPDTGVAVYQTYGDSGWAVYGGTSAASPISWPMYALAGTPGEPAIIRRRTRIANAARSLT